LTPGPCAADRPYLRVFLSSYKLVSQFPFIVALIGQKLERMVKAVPDLGPASRVITVGFGTGVLIPYLQVHLQELQL
jgi:hypothetical protein